MILNTPIQEIFQLTDMFKYVLLAGLGGGIGSMLRYVTGIILKSSGFPLATFIINITGSLLIGMILALSLKDQTFSNNWKVFLATGFCGGFTTFSAFSAENLQLMQDGKTFLSMVYITISIIAGIAATWLGFKIAG